MMHESQETHACAVAGYSQLNDANEASDGYLHSSTIMLS